jgi:hypothetical protein
MSTFEEKKTLRLAFMNALYELDEEAEHGWVRPSDLANALGLEVGPNTLPDDENYRKYAQVADYLKGEGLIETLSTEHFTQVAITHKGRVEVEKALGNPDQSTDYFPPAARVINLSGTYIEGSYTGGSSIGGDVINSQVQQAGPGSTQSIEIVTEETHKELERYIPLLRSKMSQLDLPKDEKLEVEADIRTIEAQLSSPKPKASTTNAALQSIKRVLEGATTSAAATELIHGAEALISSLSSGLS